MQRVRRSRQQYLQDGKELIAGRDFQFVMPANAGIQVLWLESSARKPGLRLPPE